MTSTPEAKMREALSEIEATCAGVDYGHGWPDAARAKCEKLAREALSLPSGWQPIETAPKDGTLVVLACCDDDMSPVVAYHGASTWCVRWDDDQIDGFDPTHWMPLPATPLPQELPNE